jgi:hypothetical protein
MAKPEKGVTVQAWSLGEKKGKKERRRKEGDQ